jgi:hypothetical protein
MAFALTKNRLTPDFSAAVQIIQLVAQNPTRKDVHQEVQQRVGEANNPSSRRIRAGHLQ